MGCFIHTSSSLQPPRSTGTPALLAWGRYAKQHAPVGSLVQLGGMLLQVFAFETRRTSEPLSAPPRTVGHTAVALAGDRTLAWANPDTAVELCLHTPEEKRSGDAAVG